jgi:hypothetical protein
MQQTPPSEVDGAAVLMFTRIDSRHEPTGACRHSVGGDLMPSASGLAICRYHEDDQVYLFYCDSSWIALTDTAHATIDAARDQAELEYRGSSQTWEPANPALHRPPQSRGG